MSNGEWFKLFSSLIWKKYICSILSMNIVFYFNSNSQDKNLRINENLIVAPLASLLACLALGNLYIIEFTIKVSARILWLNLYCINY